jgi:hypothetical protein
VSQATQVRFRMANQGTVMLEGHTIRAWEAHQPVLKIGDHIITSLMFYTEIGWWTPLGVFAVRDGHVVPLSEQLESKEYDSVDQFAALLANPPPVNAPR